MAGGPAPLVSVSHPLGVGLPPLSVGLWLRLLTRTFAARRERACQPPFHDVHPLSRARLRAAQPTGSRQPHSFIRLYLGGIARGFRYRRRCLGRSRSYTHSTSAAEENQQQSGQGWQGVPASVLYTSAYSLYYIVGVVPTITVVYPDVPGILAGILMCWLRRLEKRRTASPPTTARPNRVICSTWRPRRCNLTPPGSTPPQSLHQARAPAQAVGRGAFGRRSCLR